ncbi:gp16 family protein [Neisseria weixii]|uniref:gp16 family protein n=1 Tax=Neisseria weixii TaxID=1853276 RepID=UPI000BB6DADF|nr:regulatory protein GemA [Neisseria weixii]ATD64872.1 GemA protein [Neisseria weixii]
METSEQKKQRLIRLIHVAKTQLMMADSDYRALLANISCGKTSSTKLGIAELELVLRAMKAKGFVVTTKQNSTAKPDIKVRPAHKAVEAQIKKIRALWLELHQMGEVRSASELSLAKFMKRMTGVDYHGWLDSDNASKVIEYLKKWQKRAERKTGVASG